MKARLCVWSQNKQINTKSEEPEGREGGAPPSEFRKEQSLEKSEMRFTAMFCHF
jgi:hypothetical protein